MSEQRPTINIIGAGRLGTTLGWLLCQRQLATIHTVCNRTLASAERATSFIGEGHAVASIETMPYADITIITTSDADIKPCFDRIPYLSDQTIVLHCSAMLSAQQLQSAVAPCCSIHPMQSFNYPCKTQNPLDQCFCAIEGDKRALKQVTPLFTALGAHTFPLSSQQKTRYHLAGVMASNFLVTLNALAHEQLVHAEIDPSIARPLLDRIMQQTLTNLKNSTTPVEALTGPIARGEYETIQKHIQTLNDPQVSECYRALSQATLAIAKLDAPIKQRLHALLCHSHDAEST